MRQVWTLRVFDKQASQPRAIEGVFHDIYVDEEDIPALKVYAEQRGLRAEQQKHVTGWISAEDAKAYIDGAIL